MLDDLFDEDLTENERLQITKDYHSGLKCLIDGKNWRRASKVKNDGIYTMPKADISYYFWDFGTFVGNYQKYLNEDLWNSCILRDFWVPQKAIDSGVMCDTAGIQVLTDPSDSEILL